jgi:integrase
MTRRRQQGEGSLYHRKTRDQWVAVADLGWKNGRRDRREFTGPAPGDALRKRDEFLGKRRDGFTLPRGRQPTVAEWVRHWLHNIAKARVDPHTWYRSYRYKCEAHVIPYFGHVKLAELAREDVEAWHLELSRVISRRGTPLSPSTIATVHAIFSSALNEAVDRGRMPRNPCSRTPPPKGPRRELEPPSTAELELVLRACPGRPDGARWALAVCTGLRQGEALALRWRDVRLADPASVTVTRSAAWTDGVLSYKEPKSAAGRRAVPLPAAAAAALRAHRDAQGVREIGGLVFTGPDGKAQKPVRDYADWQRLLRDLGLPRYRVHDLRHAYATMLLEEGTDPRVVQELMGHSSTAMLKVYQHVRPAMHARVVSSIDKLFGDG